MAPDTRWQDRLALFVVGLLLTLTIAFVATSTTVEVGERALGAYAVDCLPGAAQQDDTPCRTTLGMPRDARGEPWLAVHPDDPAIVVVGAIGRSDPDDAAHALGARPPEEDPAEPGVDEEVRRLLEPEEAPPEDELLGAPCAGLRLCLHVTTDGGATWAARSFPESDRYPMVADPSMVFTDDGILHVVGHRASGALIVYARTADLGRTWIEPVALSPPAGVDRPFLATDGTTLVVTWQTTEKPYRAQLAYSDDGGTTWQQSSDFGPHCSLQSTAFPLDDGRWLIGCTARGGLPGRLVATITLADDTATTREVTDGWRSIPFFADHPSGDIVRIESGAPWWIGGTILVQTSPDDGITWRRPYDILQTASIDDSWSWHWLSAATTDAQGTAHLLVVGGPGEHCYNQRCGDPGNDRTVAWLAVDPQTGDLLGEAVLAQGARGRPVDAQAPVSDDYHHVVPYREGVLLAWGHDAGVEVAQVRPT